MTDIVTYAGLPIVPQFESLDTVQNGLDAAVNAALPHLRRPFAPQAIRFKVNNTMGAKADPAGVIVVTYIDARLVIERLNAVVGGAWTFAPVRVADDPKLMIGHLTIFGRTLADVGGSPKGMSKDLWSDALKRAAVPWGIGVSVYSLPEIKMWLKDEAGEEHPALNKYGSGDKTKVELTPAGHARLRLRYRSWLDVGGERLFGKVLDHGDVASDDTAESNDPDAPAEGAQEPAVPVLPELTDERAEALKEAARALYAEVKELKGGKQVWPQGVFATQLTASHHSHEELEKLVAALTADRDRLKGGSA